MFLDGADSCSIVTSWHQGLDDTSISLGFNETGITDPDVKIKIKS